VGKIRALNEWIRAYANQNGFGFADYSLPLDNGAGAMKPGLSYDGVHPTHAGYLAMETIATAAISEALVRNG
jgi:lysophospholipase L1-like esterase